MFQTTFEVIVLLLNIQNNEKYLYFYINKYLEDLVF